jgi:hypothetical protein
VRSQLPQAAQDLGIEVDADVRGTRCGRHAAQYRTSRPRCGRVFAGLYGAR